MNMVNVARPDIKRIINVLRSQVRGMTPPIVTEISKNTPDPFEVLVSTVLSLRTKDQVTRQATGRLFKRAHTPQEILALSEDEIARLIYPVGFYNTKAMNLRKISSDLIEQHGGRVPDTLEELLKLKGVGRKTANLVITLGYGKLGVCVDTHVHRISNRLGYVRSRTPEETETALREKLPKEYWIEFNDLLVTWGQNVCRPVSPFCSRCGLISYCKQVGVEKHR
ncbi:MAG: endonuclease III [Desulfomonile sp.]